MIQNTVSRLSRDTDGAFTNTGFQIQSEMQNLFKESKIIIIKIIT